MKASVGLTFGLLLRLFIHKAKLNISHRYYGLYLVSETNKKVDEDLLDPQWRLSKIPLPVPVSSKEFE